MDKSRGSERNKYMQNTVNPAYAQAMAQQMAMGARVASGCAAARIMQQGMQRRTIMARKRQPCFSNMVNLREQYFPRAGDGQQQQDRQVSGLGEALQQAKQQRILTCLVVVALVACLGLTRAASVRAVTYAGAVRAGQRLLPGIPT